MEVDKDYASKGVGNTALGLSIGSLGAQLLSGGLNGILGGGMGWNTGCATGCGNGVVNRYEAAQSARIAELETEVKLRDANVYTLGEMGKLRDYVDAKFDGINAQLGQQAVVNAQITANLSCMQGQIAVLQGLTKTVIPIGSICPEVMPRFNSWTAPTEPAAG